MADRVSIDLKQFENRASIDIQQWPDDGFHQSEFDEHAAMLDGSSSFSVRRFSFPNHRTAVEPSWLVRALLVVPLSVVVVVCVLGSISSVLESQGPWWPGPNGTDTSGSQ